MKLKLSFCEFQNGEFDLYIKDAEGDMQVTLTGKTSQLSDKEREFLSRAMPPCGMTDYKEVG